MLCKSVHSHQRTPVPSPTKPASVATVSGNKSQSSNDGNAVCAAVWKYSALDRAVREATINRRSIKRRQHVGSGSRPLSLQAPLVPVKPGPLGAAAPLGSTRSRVEVLPPPVLVKDDGGGCQRWSSVERLTAKPGGRRCADTVSLFESAQCAQTHVHRKWPLPRSRTTIGTVAATVDESVKSGSDSLPPSSAKLDSVKPGGESFPPSSTQLDTVANPGRAPTESLASRWSETEAPKKPVDLEEPSGGTSVVLEPADKDCSLRCQVNRRKTEKPHAPPPWRLLETFDQVPARGPKGGTSTDRGSCPGAVNECTVSANDRRSISNRLSALTLVELQRYVREMPLPAGSPPSKPPRSFTYDVEDVEGASFCLNRDARVDGKHRQRTLCRVGRSGVSGARSSSCADTGGVGGRLLRLLPCVTSSTEYAYAVGSVIGGVGAITAVNDSSTTAVVNRAAKEHVYDTPYSSVCCDADNNNNKNRDSDDLRRCDGVCKDVVQPYAVSEVIGVGDAALAGTSWRGCVTRSRLRHASSDDSLISASACVRSCSATAAEKTTPLLRRKPAILRRQRRSLRLVNAGIEKAQALSCSPADSCPSYARAGSTSSTAAAIASEAAAVHVQKSMQGSLSAVLAAGGGSEISWRPTQAVLLRCKHVKSVRDQMQCFPDHDRDCPLMLALVVLGFSGDSNKHSLQSQVLFHHPTDVEIPDCVRSLCVTHVTDSEVSPCGSSSDKSSTCLSGQSAPFCVTSVDTDGRLVYGVCQLLPKEHSSSPVVYCLFSHRPALSLHTKILTVLLELHSLRENERRLIVSRLCSQSLPAIGQSVCVSLPPGSSRTPQISHEMEDKWAEFEVVRSRDWLTASSQSLPDLLWLLQRIGVDLTISLFASALLERRIILCSRRTGWLWRAVSAVLSSLCPFVWHQRVVPVLPDGRAPLLADSAPGLFGVTPNARPLTWLKPGDQCICVDLDTATLLSSVGDELSILPSTTMVTLRDQLTPHYSLSRSADLSLRQSAADGVHCLLVSTLTRLIGRDLTRLCRSNTANLRETLMDHCSDGETRGFLFWFCETSHFRWLTTSLSGSCSDGSPFIAPSDSKTALNSEITERLCLLTGASSPEHRLRRQFCRRPNK